MTVSPCGGVRDQMRDIYGFPAEVFRWWRRQTANFSSLLRHLGRSRSARPLTAKPQGQDPGFDTNPGLSGVLLVPTVRLVHRGLKGPFVDNSGAGTPLSDANCGTLIPESLTAESHYNRLFSLKIARFISDNLILNLKWVGSGLTGAFVDNLAPGKILLGYGDMRYGPDQEPDRREAEPAAEPSIKKTSF